mmetsp:Transcript_32183/g.75571  ORF Transcript_32183/g.75571 Transcript_32183/m.75571 type:complete len:137 (-) Transcript_32183:144-554(-)
MSLCPPVSPPIATSSLYLPTQQMLPLGSAMDVGDRHCGTPLAHASNVNEVAPSPTAKAAANRLYVERRHHHTSTCWWRCRQEMGGCATVVKWRCPLKMATCGFTAVKVVTLTIVKSAMLARQLVRQRHSNLNQWSL